MQIDLANWFEIATAIVVLICLMKKPAKSTVALASILLITLSVEFTSKYLNQLYSINLDRSYITQKLMMYSLFNIVKFCGFTWFIFFLLKDKIDIQLYRLTSLIILVFVIVNISFIQGYKVYNNYSNVVGIIGLTALSLYKLRKFEDVELPKWEKIAILVYLFTLFFYYAINLPTYVLFNQMYAQNRSQAAQTYRLINDSANYIFYPCLSIATILFTLNNRSNNLSVQLSMT